MAALFMSMGFFGMYDPERKTVSDAAMTLFCMMFGLFKYEGME